MSVPQRRPWTAGIWAKRNRAERHLADLNERAEQYLDTGPYVVRIDEDPKTDRCSFVMTVVQQPPLQLSVIIGDCLQNLRATLDHIAWELVYANGGLPRLDPPRTQFPIYTSSVTSKGNPRVVEVPPGIDSRAQSIIEGFQPYHRRHNPHAHPLAILQDLSNADKHRTLHLTAARVADSELYLVAPDGERFGGRFDVGVLHDEDTIATLQLPPGGTLPSDLRVEGMGASFVGFLDEGPWGDRPVILILDDLLQYVTNIVIAGLQPFLDQSPKT